MRIRILIFFPLVLISGCSSSLWEKYKINKSLIEQKASNQGQLKLIDSTWQVVKSNSQSKIVRTDNRTEVLNFCSCKLNGDTLKVTAFELTRRGASPEISIFRNKFEAVTTFYIGNDYDHKEKYELRIASVNQSLQLNKSVTVRGTQLIGYIDIQSKLFQHYDQNSAVEFKGQFQCIVE